MSRVEMFLFYNYASYVHWPTGYKNLCDVKILLSPQFCICLQYHLLSVIQMPWEHIDNPSNVPGMYFHVSLWYQDLLLLPKYFQPSPLWWMLAHS